MNSLNLMIKEKLALNDLIFFAKKLCKKIIVRTFVKYYNMEKCMFPPYYEKIKTTKL